jgi:hypothetical protein
MPLLPGLDQDQSDRYTVAIVGGVVPEITQLALGRLLGLTEAGLGSYSQNPYDLQRFFMEGNWHGQPLELMDFEEWLNNPDLPF